LNVDFIIVGQGLAGTLLASALEDIGKTFILIDDLNRYAASRQAAGIINPITGRRYVKSWNYDVLENYFISFYARQNKKLNQVIFTEHEILLCLSSIKEENDLLAQASRYEYSDKISFIPFPSNILSEHRSAVYSLQGYKLNISGMCDAFREVWIKQGLVWNQPFDYNINFDQEKIKYKSITAGAVVFCEGAFINRNPYFNHVPVIPNKGQFMLIDKEDWKGSFSVKDKIIISPTQDGLWVGATYEWAYDSIEPDLKAREELTVQLDKLIKAPYTVKNVLSGLRPTTKNRRPLILRHPVHSKLWAINGFGTKGSSIGPYLINQFLRIYFKNEENRFDQW